MSTDPKNKDKDILDPNDRIMKAEDLSALLSVPLRTILRLAKDGRIPALKVGGRWRFERDVIEHWMKDISSYRGRGKVLLVDDNPADRQSIRRPLEHMNLMVTEAGSIEEAIDWIRRDKYDAILLDLVFPEKQKSGLDLLDWMGEEGKAIPIIIASGYANGEMLQEVLKYGTFVILSKPILKEQLKEACAMVFRWKDFKKKQ